MFKIMPIYIMLFVLFTSITAACDSTKNDEGEEYIVSLIDVIKSDLLNVNGIDVQFADGNKMSITDSKTIQDIILRIKSIRLRETKSKGVGYLYFLDLKEGDKTYRFDSSLTFDGKTYEAIDDSVKELNDFIIKIGKDKIPGLLPGVEDSQG
ncbi:hypothetical protein [Paenibacillus sp. J2TS4]|uniref:hypothetical protein n=1 Tax=Paenibacillus sp. J2TS4 TaxID=2807194 RepID=UPI001B1DD6A6|nr:hypothetical protein [Paenibacillus sp. J2TS4]GIP30799.1 hypothetical protein J2TS4_00090 [Paenibacillus sp. J2TS4]